MAELLVRAQKHWMDDLKQEDVDKMTAIEKEHYEARCQIGDVVAVRPDGWKWGKLECPPEFVIVKIPDMKVEDAEHFNKQLNEVVTESGKERLKMVRFRKYALPKTDIETAKTSAQSISLTESSLALKTVTKTGLSTEVSQPKTGIK